MGKAISSLRWRYGWRRSTRRNDRAARLLRRTEFVWVEVRKARMMTAERKADTRHKIQLGGLIVKAGLAAEEPAVLLGRLTAGAAAEVGEWRGGFGSARRTPHATRTARRPPRGSPEFKRWKCTS